MGPRPARRHAAGREMAGHGMRRGQQCPASTKDRAASAPGDVRVVVTCRTCAALAARRQGVPPHRWCQTRARGAPRRTPHQRRSLPAPPGPRLPSSASLHGRRNCSTLSIASQGPHGGRLRQTTADEGRGVRLIHAHGACRPPNGADGSPRGLPTALVPPFLSPLIGRKQKGPFHPSETSVSPCKK